MPTFRVRALVNGKMSRSWGESADKEAAHAKASAQLAKVTKNFESVSVEEIDPCIASAEALLACALNADRVDVPED